MTDRTPLLLAVCGLPVAREIGRAAARAAPVLARRSRWGWCWSGGVDRPALRRDGRGGRPRADALRGGGRSDAGLRPRRPRLVAAGPRLHRRPAAGRAARTRSPTTWLARWWAGRWPPTPAARRGCCSSPPTGPPLHGGSPRLAGRLLEPFAVALGPTPGPPSCGLCASGRGDNAPSCPDLGRHDISESIVRGRHRLRE